MKIKAADLLAYSGETGTKAKRGQLQVHLEYTVDDVVEYEWLGDDTTESSISVEVDDETITNIKDIKVYTVNSVTRSQEMSPFFVKAGSRTHQVILTALSNGNTGIFSQFTAILVQEFLTLDGKAYAERHVNCGITVGDYGGSAGGVDLPITLSYSDEKTLGYWEKNETTGKMEFKPKVAPTP